MGNTEEPVKSAGILEEMICDARVSKEMVLFLCILEVHRSKELIDPQASIVHRSRQKQLHG